MPTLLVAGTSLLQIAVTSGLATVLHATANGTVDIVLAALLVSGGILGTRIGVGASRLVTGATARVCLAMLILAVAVAMGRDMFIGPTDPFSVAVRGV